MSRPVTPWFRSPSASTALSRTPANANATKSFSQPSGRPADPGSNGRAIADSQGGSSNNSRPAQNNQTIYDKRVQQAQHLEEIGGQNGNAQLTETSARVQEISQTNYTRRAEAHGTSADEAGSGKATPNSKSLRGSSKASAKSTAKKKKSWWPFGGN